ncbi:MAG TPA: TIGR03790 family protein, partial [Roseimicrobium sp.]|nr:TIGR03790 family protein [Roseimicrobium sp.]
ASEEVARHYASRRSVPDDQVIGLKLPEIETMNRREYSELLEAPLAGLIEKRGWWKWGGANGTSNKVVSAKIRYLVLCYGVPVRSLQDGSLVEPAVPGMADHLKVNTAAVDSELSCLPRLRETFPRAGFVLNSQASTLVGANLHPTNGVLMVARLDGPTPEIANQLVDKAMLAERHGLWGRAYMDVRGIKDGAYKAGDDWINQAAEASRLAGYETVVDDRPETFGPGFPLSQVALYAGWYDGNISGPFSGPTVEFMPGAIAYHLHSYSAHVLRSPDKHWVGPLLSKGATATMGSVDEPYLMGTPMIGVVLDRILLRGFTFGEAAYAGSPTLSWMTTMVGDPLYRPFQSDPARLHLDLARARVDLLNWFILRAVNVNRMQGIGRQDAVRFLREQPETARSAVLLEKKGDLLVELENRADAIDAYAAALERSPSPQQRIRILISLMKQQTAMGKNRDAVMSSLDLLACSGVDHPDRAAWLKTGLELATRFGLTAEADRLRRLSGQ